MIASYEHSSLFGLVINNEGKKFYNIGPGNKARYFCTEMAISGASVIKLFTANPLQQIFQVFLPSTGRAVIPVNPTLSERLTSLDFQAIIEGKEANLKLHPQVFQLFNREQYYY